jgi:N-acetylglucosamine-6-sulfatase
MATRSHAAARALGLLAVAASLLVLLASSAPAGTRPARPNVVVIMTDDQTLESLRVMTNTRKLIADQGTTFDNYFVSFPLCCPSRATFLTGRYSHNTGVVGNNFRNGLAQLDETDTLPVWLKASGYSTIFVGKYLNEYQRLQGLSIPPGWDQWYAGEKLGYFNHSMNRNGKLAFYGSSDESYQTDVYTNTAVNLLHHFAAEKAPFFMWLSYFAPHYGGPREPGDPAGLKTPVPAPRHRGRFANAQLPRPPSFDEADVEDKPRAIRNKPRLDPTTIAGLTSSYRQRLESLLAVDEGVARVIATLRQAGALDKTLIVFTSDNGYLEGEHRVADAKEQLYEPSIRVPLLMRGPGVPRGLHLSQLTVNADLAPTIAAATGTTPSLGVDGRSLLPLLTGPGREWGRDILLERGPGGNLLEGRLYTAIRTPRYVYAEYSSGERELYDLQEDPYELTSRHDDPEYLEVRLELARRLAQLRDCAGVTCRRGPDILLERARVAGCVKTVSIGGADARLVRAVDFDAGGAARRVERPPFQLDLDPHGAARDMRVRALATLLDGRRVTRAVSAHVCASS